MSFFYSFLDVFFIILSFFVYFFLYFFFPFFLSLFLCLFSLLPSLFLRFFSFFICLFHSLFFLSSFLPYFIICIFFFSAPLLLYKIIVFCKSVPSNAHYMCMGTCLTTIICMKYWETLDKVCLIYLSSFFALHYYDWTVYSRIISPSLSIWYSFGDP
jgi:hypothetical protein